jgi:Tfp pilus assembly protein PilV
MRPIRSIFSRLKSQRGQSLVEILMTLAVLVIGVQTATLVVSTLAKQNVANRDRIFATEKALQMLEELRQLILVNNATLTTLDQFYEDGNGLPVYKWTLTTKWDITHVPVTNAAVPDAISATDPHSANPLRNGCFGFVRHIDIWSNTQDANVRTIYVRVYKAAPNCITPTPANPGSAPLAEVYGEVHSLGSVVGPQQTMDVYLLALENVPGWWTRTSNLIPLMQAAVVNIQAMNPGLSLRTHWIQTLSYGRDLEYTPEINAENVTSTVTTAFKKTYVLPGYVDFNWDNTANSGSGASTNYYDYYYLPSWFLGRINIGGSLPGTTGWPADALPNLGYAMADQYNHAMRYPDELNLYKILCQIAQNQGSQAPQMSLRMLMELLAENDPSVQNAIVVNLHGEMLPLPPLRNYSDAARDPDYYYAGSLRSYRAVTQPEQLWYNSATSVSPAVRVYAYDSNPSELTNGAGTNGDANPLNLIDTITVFVPNATLANLAQMERVQGNSQTYYKRFILNATAGGFNTYTNGTYTAISDAPSGIAPAAGNCTYLADIYSPPGRGTLTGLRIRMFGVTPTARVYNGPLGN